MKTLILFVGLVCLARADDLTLEDFASGSEVVEAVIDILDQSCVFTDNKQMLRRIAKLETNDGDSPTTYQTTGQDTSGGIWRVDENKLRDISTRSDLFDKIEDAFGVDWSTVTISDMVKPLYSGIAARVWIDTMPTKGWNIPWDESAQALYWASTYHSGSVMTFQDYLDVIGQLTETCDSDKADIVFVLDGSGSIGDANFLTMKNFVVSVIDAFNVAEDNVRIGVIKYSKNSKDEFYLGEITEKQAVRTEVQRIIYEKGGTNTAAALDDLREMFELYGRGGGVPKISIVLTDGQSNDPVATVESAQKVHDDKVTVFAVGVGSGVYMDELREIGSDPECIHVHTLGSFQDIDPFTSKIQEQACKAPAEINPDEEYEGEVETGKRLFFKLVVKRNMKGITVKLRMKSGATRLYLSFKARNPGRAIFKYQLRVQSSDKNGGNMYIPFPTDVDELIDEVDMFAGLLGDGVGQRNLFGISSADGDQSDATVIRPGLVMLLVAAFVALM